MKVYDISMEISPEMAVYKNRDEKKPVIEVVRDFNNSSAYETRIQLDMHTGTHIDMPLHMINGGADSEFWTTERFFSHCTVLDFTDIDHRFISKDDLQRKEDSGTGVFQPPGKGRSVLLKTVNSQSDDFDFSFTYLHRSGADYLVNKEIAGVGIDALGIERDQPGHETHKTLLDAGIWILEGLRLAEVPEGDYILTLMPLRIKGVEALPARAVLVEAESFSGWLSP